MLKNITCDLRNYFELNPKVFEFRQRPYFVSLSNTNSNDESHWKLVKKLCSRS
jgi:hypothetical protein